MCTGLPATPVLDSEPGRRPRRSTGSTSPRTPNFTTGRSTTLRRSPPTAAGPGTRSTRSRRCRTAPPRRRTTRSSSRASLRPSAGPTAFVVDPADHAFKKTSPKVGALAPAERREPGYRGRRRDRHGDHLHLEDYFDRNQATTYDATGETSHSGDAVPSSRSTTSRRSRVRSRAGYSSTSRRTRRRTSSIPKARSTGACSRSTAPATRWAGPRPAPSSSAVSGRHWSRRSAPSPADSFRGTVPFRWDAQPFAGKYEIQVAKDADTNFSADQPGDRHQADDPGGLHRRGFRPLKTLPALTTPYVWQVAASTRSTTAVPWSDSGSFYSLGEAPLQLTTDSSSVRRRGCSAGPGRRRGEVPRRVPARPGQRS